MTGTWATDWATGDVVTAAEFRKSVGCISDTTLGIASASFDLSSLPTTYAHMTIECYLRGTVAATSTGWSIRFNADSGPNYDNQGLAGTAAAAAAGETFAQTSLVGGTQPGNSAPASVFGLLRIEIPNYAYASGNKVVFMTTSDKRGTTTGLLTARVDSGYWRSNAAISRITIAPASGSWDVGSRCSIYVKGS
jgi:hypothetical protein